MFENHCISVWTVRTVLVGACHATGLADTRKRGNINMIIKIQKKTRIISAILSFPVVHCSYETWLFQYEISYETVYYIYWFFFFNKIMQRLNGLQWFRSFYGLTSHAPARGTSTDHQGQLQGGLPTCISKKKS